MRLIRAGRPTEGTRAHAAAIAVAFALAWAVAVPASSPAGSTSPAAAKKKCKVKGEAKKKRCKKNRKKQRLPLNDGLSMDPTYLEFGSQSIALASAPRALTVTNTGNYNSGHLSLAFGGPNQSAFPIVSENCSFAQLPAGARCTINISFAPQSVGTKSTTLSVVGTQGGTDVSLLRGTGTL